jgi:hypothetical protein
MAEQTERPEPHPNDFMRVTLSLQFQAKLSADLDDPPPIDSLGFEMDASRVRCRGSFGERRARDSRTAVVRLDGAAGRRKCGRCWRMGREDTRGHHCRSKCPVGK